VVADLQSADTVAADLQSADSANHRFAATGCVAADL
jgi:hypothetical protein